jgi:iron complex transport system substrate-binding protein
MLELLLALGVQPAGYAELASSYLKEYDQPSQQIPYLGDRVTSQPISLGDAYNPSLERLLQAKPDLILGTEENAPQYDIFSRIAPTLLLPWDGVEAGLNAIAQALNRTDQVELLLAKRNQQIERTRQAMTAIVAAHPKIAMLSSSTAQQFNLVTVQNSVCGSLVKALGFELVYPDDLNKNALSNLVIPLSVENLQQFNDADSILILGYNFRPVEPGNDIEQAHVKIPKQDWENSAIAQSLRASKAGRIYFISSYLCYGLPGPIGTELYLNKLQEKLLTHPS